MPTPDPEHVDAGGPTRAAPGLAHQLARADLKARLFGPPAESSRIGRYAVLRKIGAGGMGVVYAAYDEQLGRKVAIKLVHPARHDPDSQARSRREAQALARLSHPNVVHVYEVGEYQDQVYVAMEFVQGQTLRVWQQLAPRRWQDTVAMYLQAGRGLAAAHARGLVHRDFKPDNVLVGEEDQRPRVVDFGLARVPGPPKGLSHEPADLSHEPADLSSASADLSLAPSDLSHEPADLSPAPGPDPARLTTPGTVLGTVAYMPPEQLVGGEADARSDVFSFCAALHEALHGVRPFTGADAPTLRAAISRGAIARPRATELPGWLQRVVERGLAADPAMRWPAMDPLLAALARDPTRWRRRAGLVALALAAICLAVLGVLEARARQQQALLDAEQQRVAVATAELERTEAARAGEQRRGEARRLATAAGLHADADPVARLLLAVEAVSVHTRAGAEPLLEAEQALLDALDGVPSTPFIRPGAGLVDAVAESPDARWLATGERDGAVTLWSTADPHTPHALLPGDGHPVHALTFSPDARHLAALRDGAGPLVWTLELPPAPKASPDIFADIPPPVPWDSPIAGLRDLEWSPHSDALLARAGQLAVVLRPDAPALPLRGHTGPVRRAAWSPDATHVVTAAADGSARVWPARGGPARLFKIPGNTRGLWSAEFSPDGRELVLAAADHSAAILPLAGGAIVRLRGHTDQVYAAGFSRDGERVITVAMDDSARVWERDGSSTRVALPGHADALGGARLGPDRDLLLGTPPGGAAWLWQIDRPGPPLVLRGHRGSVVAARFSADGRRLLTASTDGSARVWRFTDDPHVLRGHDAGIEHAAFAPDGRSLVTAGMDGTTRVWSLAGAPPLLLRGHREGSSITAAFSPDSQRLATAGSDGLARLWSLTSRPPLLLATLPAEPDRGAALLAVQWSPDGQRLAIAADDGQIFLVTLAADGHPMTTEVLRGHAGPVRALAFAPTGELLASAGDDATIRRWRLDHRPVSSDILTGHHAPVRSLAFTADASSLLSAGDDAVARVWPLAEPGPPRLLEGHVGAIWHIGVVPRTGEPITASADGTARIWPPHDPVVVLGGHADAVWIAAADPDGRAIVTISSDGTARLWRPRDGEYVALLLSQRGTAGGGVTDDTLWTGGFSPDGRLILTAGADGLARLFPARLADQISAACARTGRNLDRATWTRLVGQRLYQRTCPELPEG